MKVIKADFTKRGKDLYYLKKQRKEMKDTIDRKIERLLAYQDLKFRGRLVTQ